MLSGLIKFSLNNRFIVLCITSFIIIYGLITLTQLPVDVFPDLNKPSVSVLTEAHGLAPEEVEALVTIPLETTINGSPAIERIRSASGVGLSILNIEFAWGADLFRSRQLVQERLQIASAKLPKDVTPIINPVSSIMGEIMLIGLSSKNGQTAPMDVRLIADKVLRPRLLSISGVSQAIAIGGGVKQYQILLSPEKLSAYGVSIEEAVKAAEDAQANTAGGYLQGANREILIRNISRTSSIEDISNTVVAERAGVPVLLKDISQVTYGKQVMRGDAGVNANPAVVISIQKQPGASTIDLTKEIEKNA